MQLVGSTKRVVIVRLDRGLRPPINFFMVPSPGQERNELLNSSIALVVFLKYAGVISDDS